MVKDLCFEKITSGIKWYNLVFVKYRNQCDVLHHNLLYFYYLHYQRLEDEYDEEQAEEDVRIAVIIITYTLFRFLEI